jgi:hypothetical protein
MIRNGVPTFDLEVLSYIAGHPFHDSSHHRTVSHGRTNSPFKMEVPDSVSLTYKSQTKQFCSLRRPN